MTSKELFKVRHSVYLGILRQRQFFSGGGAAWSVSDLLLEGCFSKVSKHTWRGMIVQKLGLGLARVVSEVWNQIN